MSYHRAQNGSLQILNTRISSVGIDPHISSKDVGILRLQLLDHLRSYILTAAAPRRSHTAHWIHKILSHGAYRTVMIYTTNGSESENFASGEGTSV